MLSLRTDTSGKCSHWKSHPVFIMLDFFDADLRIWKKCCCYGIAGWGGGFNFWKPLLQLLLVTHQEARRDLPLSCKEDNEANKNSEKSMNQTTLCSSLCYLERQVGLTSGGGAGSENPREGRNRADRAAFMNVQGVLHLHAAASRASWRTGVMLVLLGVLHGI